MVTARITFFLALITVGKLHRNSLSVEVAPLVRFFT